MAYIMVDIEADGPIPGDYSMVCFGAIVVEPSLDRTFYGRLKPISDKWIAEVKVKSVKKKLKDKAFARAVNRDDVRSGAEALGVELGEHIEVNSASNYRSRPKPADQAWPPRAAHGA